MLFKIVLLLLIMFNVNGATINTFKKDTFAIKNNKNITITFIKHGSLIIGVDDYNIYIDPVSEYVNYKELPKADLILITHEHYDHFDKNAINDLKKNQTQIILNQATQKLLGYGKVLNNNEKMIQNNIEILAFPSYNTTNGRTNFHPKGRDNGYILSIDNFKIYIAGDTENIPEMANLKNIDIAFLPVNQPYTMTPEQAVLSAKTIKPKILYPYHYSDTKIEKVVELLKSSAIEVRIRDMQ